MIAAVDLVLRLVIGPQVAAEVPGGGEGRERREEWTGGSGGGRRLEMGAS